MKNLLIIVCMIFSSCTTYNYLGDPRLMGTSKRDTIPDVIISPLPPSFLEWPKLNLYPGAENYLIEPYEKGVIQFDTHGYIDSCIIINLFKPLNI